MTKTCPICNKLFETEFPFQVYCCHSCARFSNRHFDKKFRENFHNQKQVFDCAYCGKHVEPRDCLDKRSKFCCQKCEKNYWKRKRKKGVL